MCHSVSVKGYGLIAYVFKSFQPENGFISLKLCVLSVTALFLLQINKFSFEWKVILFQLSRDQVCHHDDAKK